MPKVTKTITCSYCGTKFDKSSSLKKHIRRCQQKQQLIESYEEKIKKMEDIHTDEINNIKFVHANEILQIRDKYEEQIRDLHNRLFDLLKDKFNFYKSAAEKNEPIISPNVSTSSKITSNCPQILPMEKFSLIQVEDEKTIEN